MPARVALVEDEPDIRQSIEEYLTLAGFSVWGVGSAEAFYRQFTASPVEVVVLDLGLPGEDGLNVAALLKANPAVAVIILSARDGLDDRLLGLRAGADRYLVKPINLEELAANIEAVLGRMGVAVPERGGAVVTSLATWVLDTCNWLLTAPDGAGLKLTAHEFALMRCLIAADGAAVSKRQLTSEIFGAFVPNAADRLNVLVTRLRRKGEACFRDPLPLKTLHQVGYVFSADARQR